MSFSSEQKEQIISGVYKSRCCRRALLYGVIFSKAYECGGEVRVSLDRRPDKCTIKTMPHPGFPTDMQPQMAVLLALAEGTSIISESIWSNRFRYVDQLLRMGAKISVEGKVAIVQGVEKLNGAPVGADDLRAGAAMLIAAFAAEGQSEIENLSHIDRGYENFVEKFRNLGADIQRVEFPDPEETVAENAG